jgi:acetyl-CoA carboxylase biotin carboxyl carrier protein
MNIQQIKKLIYFIGQSTVNELAVSDGICSVRIRQIPPNTEVALPDNIRVPSSTASVTTAETVSQVMSSCVGLFYRQSDAACPPYVEIGQQVKKGDILGVIKMMQVSNPVLAVTDGIIAAILVENGQPVEYAQPLFTLG